MARITVYVCDECGSQEDVKHYEIREGSRKAIVDLCQEHSVDLERCLSKVEAKPEPVATRPRSSRARPRKVTTMEEIEALKRKSS